MGREIAAEARIGLGPVDGKTTGDTGAKRRFGVRDHNLDHALHETGFDGRVRAPVDATVALPAAAAE